MPPSRVGRLSAHRSRVGDSSQQGLRSAYTSVMNASSSQLRLRLLKPVRHAHLAVHRRRCGEVLVALLAIARAREQLPEAEVAVGDERPYAQLGPEIRRLPEI